MDSSAFDHLTRLFASTPTRRGFGGTLLGSVAALIGLDEALAAPCPKGKKPCRKTCIPKRRCCTNANCRPRATGKVCRKGRCVCPKGRKPCEGRCIPRAQCCGAACPECVRPEDCPTPTAPCGIATCIGGVCGVAPAPASTRVCRVPAGPCDIAEECDGVSLDCPEDQFQAATVRCRFPGCVGPTELGLAANCTGTSAECPASDRQTCAADQFCEINACVPKRGPGGSCFGGVHQCQAGLFCVGGFCCTTACVLTNAITTCASGTCTLIGCQPNFGNCDGNPANGCETLTVSSPQHCGRCNNPCAVGTQCPRPGGGTGTRFCIGGQCLCV